MYLKSIEVQGFKSFANRMKFQFHNGITGIVGPNGSGKSNVGDAVRWVLGEQRAKQLRGGSMQDVIFSGTETRKPLGFAMVSITLDNSDHALPVDYEEVTVTRRLYRSGESEYQINGANCRLRDINEMFYDTGIGKEGYSIIGQGQVDKILNGKPEERRELFDEAAGIVKFKRRKITAQKKLDDENNNLTRITDILSELTRQIGPLERQSEKARIYLKKKEELKKCDINMFLMDMERLHQQLCDVEEKLSISDTDIAQLREQLEQARKEYEEVEAALEELNALIETKREQISKGQVVRQQFEGQINLIREQIRSAQNSDEHFLSRMRALETEISTREEQARQESEKQITLQEQLITAASFEEEKSETLNALNVECSQLESDVAAGQSALITLLNDRSNTKAKMQRYDTMREQIQIRQAELTGRILSAKSEEAQQEEARAVFQADLDKINNRIASLRNEGTEIERKINEKQKELTDKAKVLEAEQAAYHREVSKLDSLRNLTERYDGYGNSIRRVMEQKNQVRGLHGVVADLLKTEKKYEIAMETALGGSIQNIVTDSEETAKRMIDFLKRNKFGRATFLPLSGIRVKGGLSNENALYEPGAIGVASILVDTEPAYEKLVDFLLGKTLVVDTIDHAIAIARKYKQSIRIVTLDGELLNPGGAMSGGAFKNNSNLLGRRREIEELEESIRERKENVEAIAKDIEHCRAERNELRLQLVRKTEEIQQESLHQNTAKLKLQEMNEQTDKSQDAMALLQNEASEMKQQLHEIELEQAMIREEMQNSKTAEQDLEKEIRGHQANLEEKRKELDVAAEECADIRTKLAGLKQQVAFVKENQDRLSDEIIQYTEEKQELERAASDSRADIAKKESEIEQITDTLNHSIEDEQRVQGEVEKLLSDRQEKTAIHKRFFEQREQLSSQLSELDKEHFRLENQKERLEDFKEKQINYMWEEYEITPSEAEGYREEIEESPAQLKKLIVQIKSDIKALGPVNVNAIEEYKEVSERHSFLSAQHDDLVKAEEELKKIISELDNGMRRQFKEQFAIMQKEFAKAFKELFGGGTGTLELVEDEDILEAGVRIIAQPPGKKLVNMMQMSGGEKALTAIALLFAIQNMKPSPFCLLDEIEAALDENNVTRYANYLHKLTKNTQFIIITHRRGTMAVADRLYGITMQEKGVSAQVSVNMVENDLDQ